MWRNCNKTTESDRHIIITDNCTVENFGIRILPLGQLQTNCYLVFDCGNHEGLIIDPGDDADYIARIIGDEKIRPLAILATHGHFDHLLAATELKLAFNIPFLIHQKDEFLVKETQKSAKHFLKLRSVDPPPPIDDFLKESQKITFGKHHLQVLETPGHTPGSVCFYLKEKGLLFCGDTVFKNGPGRTDLSYSLPQNMKNSLAKLLLLPPKTIFYPGHGGEFTKEELKSIIDNSITS